MEGLDQASYLFIDSHLHLGDSPDPMVDLRLSRASRELLVTNGTDKATSLRGLELAEANLHLLRSFVGVHPSEARRERNLEDWLEPLVVRASGLGEVGLDPRYSGVQRGTAQMDSLSFQLALAEKRRKPVQVHTRNAEKACLDELGTYRLEAVLLHWFQGEDQLRTVLDRGYYASFGPAILFSKKLQKMATTLNRQRVVAESDSPVRFGALGGVGGAWLIPSVVFRLSELFRTPFDETAKLLVSNGISFLAGGH